jgi:hypothetical protein
MKIQNKLLKLSLIPALLVVFCLFSANSSAEVSAKKERVRMKMYYFKTASGDRRIDIALTAGSGKSMHGVSEGEVALMAVAGDSTLNLATVTTDTLGQVSLYLAEDYVLPMDEDGKVVLEAEYEGNDIYGSASNDIELMDLSLTISFEIEDSVKYLRLEATRPDIEGNMVPVEELSVLIGVQRLYSVLPLDDVETDDDGFAEMEFPNDIPGDADGMITIVAKVDDSDSFGTVEVKATADWGTAVSYELQPLPRQLFTDEAPLWMIAAVYIILLGAWYHFFLSISKLIKVKKAGSDS